jgi:hypothetical protein
MIANDQLEYLMLITQSNFQAIKAITTLQLKKYKQNYNIFPTYELKSSALPSHLYKQLSPLASR